MGFSAHLYGSMAEISKTYLLFFLAVPAGGFLVAMVFFGLGFSFFLPVAVTLFMCATLFCFKDPVFFLGAATIIRMVLDYSAEYVSVQVLDGFTLTLSQLVGVELFLVGLVCCGIYWRSLRTLPLKLPTALLLGAGALTLFYSVDRQETLKELLRMGDLFMLYAVGYAAVQNRTDHRKIILAVMLSACIPSVVAFYQFITQAGFYDEALGISRIYGTFSHPNVFSLYLFIVIAAAFLYVRLYALTPRQRAAAILFMAVESALLVLTLTRVGWIALIVFALFMALMFDRRWIAALAAASLAIYLLSPVVQERASATLHPQPGDSFTWRIDLWEDGIVQTLHDDRWRWGYGLNTFPMVAEHLREDRFGGNDPHNDFVKFFVEGGLVGLGVWLLYIAGVAGFLAKQSRTLPLAEARFSQVVLLGVFAGMIVAGLSDNAFKNTPLQWVFWLLMGANVGIFKVSGTHLKRRNRKSLRLDDCRIRHHLSLCW